jgi:glutamate-5-semialdehyde dehydrogenase
VADSSVLGLGRRAKAASQVLAGTSGASRDSALRLAADLLEEQMNVLLSANSRDVSEARADDGSAPPALDRLRLSEGRVRSMSEGLRALASLPEVVGEVVEGYVRPNGLRVERVRVPLGVVGVIYENRPNVTADAAGLCLKSANAVMLRGSSAAIESNKAIVSCLREALTKSGLPEDSIVLVEDTSRDAAVEFMRLEGIIDCLVPRGGHSLVASVRENATVPVVIDGDGNCHVYVDSTADLAMASAIVVNAKTQRPGVCNALETLLVHKDIAGTFLPRVRGGLEDVVLVGDERVRNVLPDVGLASEEDFATEFLAMKMSVAVVDDLVSAIEHIRQYSSGHSEAIVTGDLEAADRFCREVDAAAVLVNASTRFVDGAELGLGAEIGISTQKLHARGPMGPRELTSVKYVIRGTGQVRT